MSSPDSVAELPVYQSDPNQEVDSGFAPGRLEHLVIDNRGRLLDSRRTPVTVVAVEPGRGSFTVRIDAFEDRGATWELGLEEVSRFQFPHEAPVASGEALGPLEEARRRHDRNLRIEVDSGALAATLDAVAGEQGLAGRYLEASARLPGAGFVESWRAGRRGDPTVFALLEDYLAARGLLELDREFARAFVSNPVAGELVKAHAMVLAQLGLCPFEGTALRDPDALREPWPAALRRRHVISRLGFTRALWEAWGMGTATLYRGAATEGGLQRQAASFVSATFSREVAEEHFQGGASTVAAVMWRQEIPVERLFMTFLETAAFNDRYLEAEAVLIGDPASPGF